jgi:drug/metabolite transporter (DMT)-like permease
MKKEYKGTIILLFTGLFYSLFGVFSRLISSTFGPLSQNWTRGILVALVCLVIALVTKKIRKIKKEDYKWLCIAGLSMSFVNPLSFIACNNLQLSTALFLLYSAIVLSSYFFGFLLLKEKMNAKKIIALVLSLIGLILILHFSIEGFKIKFALASVLSGAIYGLFTVSTKKVSGTYSPAFINFVVYTIVVIVNMPLAIILRDKITFDIVSSGWLFNLIFGFNVIVTFLLLIKGFKYIEIQKGSLILLSEIIFVILWGILLYKEVPSFTEVVGGLLVIIAMGVPLFSFKKKDVLS